MDTVIWIVVAIGIIAVLATGLFAWTMSRKRRSERLREGFGTEYDREVQRVGRGKAESELEQRKKRVEQLSITALSGQQAVGYQRDWDGVQSHFVDDPSGAISDADDLVGKVMQARGYPMGDFDQRIADISVDHSEVASNTGRPTRLLDATVRAKRQRKSYGRPWCTIVRSSRTCSRPARKRRVTPNVGSLGTKTCRLDKEAFGRSIVEPTDAEPLEAER